MAQNYNSMYIKASGEQPIVINKAFCNVFGDMKTAAFLSQLLYWFGRGKYKGWIWKTIEEMQNETTLTRSEQDRAVKKLKKEGVLKTKLHGAPPCRFFNIDEERLQEIMSDYYTKRDESENVLSPEEEIKEQLEIRQREIQERLTIETRKQQEEDEKKYGPLLPF